MTPSFCCGAECGQLGTGGQHWQDTSGGGAPVPTFSTGTVRSGARSLKCSGAKSSAQTPSIFSTAAGAKNSYRFYINFESLPVADTLIASDNGVVSGAFFQQSDSTIYARANGTNGSTGVAVTTGVWYRIDGLLDFSFNANAGVSVDVRVNGVACGQATNTTSPGTGANFRVGNVDVASSATLYIDDVVTSQTAGDYPIGAGYVNHFIPTSDGTHNVAGTGDFQRTLTGTDILNATTTAFQLVDDVPLESGASVDWINMIAPPNATDYVECVFGPASGISTPTAGPRAVEVIAGIHQSGTGTGNMEIRINDNGTTNAMYSATGVAGVTSVAYKRKHYATAIAGGGAWTVTSGNGNFNNLRVRFGSPGAVDANPDQFFDCIMVEAEFVEAVIAVDESPWRRVRFMRKRMTRSQKKHYLN